MLEIDVLSRRGGFELRAAFTAEPGATTVLVGESGIHSREDALRLQEAGIDAMLVDAPQLAEMSRLLRCSPGTGDRDSRPLLFALTRGDSLAERMFALRAGADEVLAGQDAGELAPRLLSALQPGRVEPYRVLIIDDSIAEKPYTDENDIICWHYDHTSGSSEALTRA